jgi:hypothetical protein
MVLAVAGPLGHKFWYRCHEGHDKQAFGAQQTVGLGYQLSLQMPPSIIKSNSHQVPIEPFISN